MQLILYFFFSDPSAREQWFQKQIHLPCVALKTNSFYLKAETKQKYRHIFLHVLGYYCCMLLKEKISENYSLPKNFSRKRLLSRLSVVRNVTWFFFYNKRCRIDNEILTHLKLMGILRPEFWLEFELSISLEYCTYVLLEMWDCRVTEIPVPRCSSFIHKWSSWFCLPSWSEA